MEALVSMIARPVGRMISELSRSVLFASLAAVLFITSYGAFLAAVAYGLSPHIGSALTSLVIALSALATGMGILLWLRARQRQARRRRHLMAGPSPTKVSATTKVAAAFLPRMFKTSPIATLLLIGAALYVSARSR